MAIETAIFYLVALALPVWLMVEEVVHRERGRTPGTKNVAAPSSPRVPATHPA